MSQGAADLGIARFEHRLATAWHATEIAPAEWTVNLSDTDLAEIDAALRAGHRAARPLLFVGRAEFPLPALGPELARLATGLEEAPGFAVIRGLPLERYGAAEARLVHWGLGRHLGIPVPLDATGRMTRFSLAQAGGLRTGGSDVESLLALEHGRVSVASTGAVHNEVLRRRPDLAKRLHGTFAFDRDAQHAPDEPPYRSLPLSSWAADRLSLRYDRAAIESAQRFAGVRPLDAEEVALLDLVDELSESPDLRLDVELAPGDLLLVNNHDVLHRRELFTRQTWLTLRHGRDLPASYLWPTPTYGPGAGRGGVTPVDLVDGNHPVRPASGR
jgi:Taurine catabolism dioxygenase TauD, TfdA family